MAYSTEMTCYVCLSNITAGIGSQHLVVGEALHEKDKCTYASLINPCLADVGNRGEPRSNLLYWTLK